MGKNLKKLEEAELEIMEVVWNSGNPVTSNYILHFLEKLYNNSIQNMITALYSSKEIKSSDIQELRNFLDKLEDE